MKLTIPQFKLLNESKIYYAVPFEGGSKHKLEIYADSPEEALVKAPDVYTRQTNNYNIQGTNTRAKDSAWTIYEYDKKSGTYNKLFTRFIRRGSGAKENYGYEKYKRGLGF